MAANRTVEFFESQFQQQVKARDAGLNSFQDCALPFLTGRVLDLGCGLGGLSLAAARRGCEVVAVDASATAIEHLSSISRNENLPVTAVKADVQEYAFEGTFDAVVAIGLLMFFPREVALQLLENVQRAVRPGGCAVVTVLLRGTTFMDVFDGDQYYLFDRHELEHAFAGWTVVFSQEGEFPARNGMVKRIMTVIARKA